MIELFFYGIVSFLVLMWIFNWICDRSSNKPLTPEQEARLDRYYRERDDYES